MHHPVVCIDEQPKQLIDEVRRPVVAPDGTVREDFEYMRHGMCVAWMFVEPLPELSVLTRQCLGRRIGELDRVAELAQQWAAARNQRQTGIDWHFHTADARTKLKYLYPKIEM